MSYGKKLFKLWLVLLLVGVGGALTNAPTKAVAGDRFITVASTTSTENSGLFAHLLPIFEADSGISVRIVAVGTGQAIRLAERGDADVLLVHHRKSEEKFVEQGFGLKRLNVMYNDYLIAGPDSDPARIGGFKSAVKAFATIAAKKSIFVSRGDNSGTHKAERFLWRKTSTDLKGASGSWYREVGAGMGATLNIAAATNAYVLVDRGTWISFANKQQLKELLAGDPSLFNQYGVLTINPAKHPHIKTKDADNFVNWLVSPKGQSIIASFRLKGQTLFIPNAKAVTPSN